MKYSEERVIEIESRLVVVRAWGKEVREVTANGNGLSFGGKKVF